MAFYVYNITFLLFDSLLYVRLKKDASKARFKKLDPLYLHVPSNPISSIWVGFYFDGDVTLLNQNNP